MVTITFKTKFSVFFGFIASFCFFINSAKVPQKNKKGSAFKKKNLTVEKSWLMPSKIFKPRAGIPEKRLVVIIASYNNKDWYIYNLESVCAQRYRNYRVIYIDDCSSDGTGKLVEHYIAQKGVGQRITLIQNTQRRTKTANMYRAVHMCDDDEIIVVLDGDDWFAHCDVLAYINQLYTNNDIWMTYGGFKCYPPMARFQGYCRRIPKKVIEDNNFRGMRRITAAQRTFYAWLYKYIKIEDLLYEGKFMPTAGDVAKMYPMFEMAGHRFTYITDPVYMYNVFNPINDFKTHAQDGLQMKIHRFVETKPKYHFLKHPGLVHPYKNETDIFLVTQSQEKFDVSLAAVRHFLTGIHQIYLITDNKEIDAHGEIVISVSDKHSIPFTDIVNSYPITDFVLVLQEDDVVQRSIDLATCAAWLQQTYAVGFYFVVHKDMFLREHACEHLMNDVYVWQFRHGSIDPRSMRGLMCRRDDLLAADSVRARDLWASERTGLFFAQSVIRDYSSVFVSQ